MKRIILLLLGAGFGLTAFAQTDQGRDLSKYADDKFSADDQYTVAVPYQTVSVKPVKSKKIKNVIVLVGDGMGLEQISVGWTLNGGTSTWTTSRLQAIRAPGPPTGWSPTPARAAPASPPASRPSMAISAWMTTASPSRACCTMHSDWARKPAWP